MNADRQRWNYRDWLKEGWQVLIRFEVEPSYELLRELDNISMQLNLFLATSSGGSKKILDEDISHILGFNRRVIETGLRITKVGSKAGEQLRAICDQIADRLELAEIYSRLPRGEAFAEAHEKYVSKTILSLPFARRV